MSDPQAEQNDERPTIEGTDPDMNLGAGQKLGGSGDDEDDGDEDRVDVEDLP